MRWAFAHQGRVECRFGVPIVDGERAAVDWYAVLTLPDGAVQTLAGTSLLRFGEDGRVLEQRDAWNERPTRYELPAWAPR